MLFVRFTRPKYLARFVDKKRLSDNGVANSSKTQCNFNYNAQAVGVGIRYKTPVGPVRFDLGYAVNPTRYPVQENDETLSLRRINIFFSIGQTF